MTLLDTNVSAWAARMERKRAEDLAAGRADIGGLFWMARYRDSYLRAGRVLVDASRAAGSFDGVAIPVLYLQRHTLELGLKYLLGMVVSAAEYNQAEHPVLASTAKVPVWGHGLRRDLFDPIQVGLRELAAVGIEYPRLPASLETLVDEFEALEERDETRLRYEQVGKGPKTRPSFPNKISVPIEHLQNELESIMETMFDEAGESLVQQLYRDLCGWSAGD